MPEAEVEVDTQGLPGTYPFEKALHVAPHRGRKLPLAPDPPENLPRVVVPPQCEERRCVVEHEAVDGGLLGNETGEDDRRLLETSQPHQRLRAKESDGGGVRAMGSGKGEKVAQQRERLVRLAAGNPRIRGSERLLDALPRTALSRHRRLRGRVRTPAFGLLRPRLAAREKNEKDRRPDQALSPALAVDGEEPIHALPCRCPGSPGRRMTALRTSPGAKCSASA